MPNIETLKSQIIYKCLGANKPKGINRMTISDMSPTLEEDLSSMFGSSLPPIACRRVCVLLVLFVLVCV